MQCAIPDSQLNRMFFPVLSCLGLVLSARKVLSAPQPETKATIKPLILAYLRQLRVEKSGIPTEETASWQHDGSGLSYHPKP